jgi:hypothetical protein
MNASMAKMRMAATAPMAMPTIAPVPSFELELPPCPPVVLVWLELDWLLEAAEVPLPDEGLEEEAPLEDW